MRRIIRSVEQHTSAHCIQSLIRWSGWQTSLAVLCRCWFGDWKGIQLTKSFNPKVNGLTFKVNLLLNAVYWFALMLMCGFLWTVPVDHWTREWDEHQWSDQAWPWKCHSWAKPATVIGAKEHLLLLAVFNCRVQCINTYVALPCEFAVVQCVHWCHIPDLCMSLNCLAQPEPTYLSNFRNEYLKFWTPNVNLDSSTLLSSIFLL